VNRATKIIKMPDFRGGPLALLKNHDHQVICVGPKDTTKTWACCAKMIYLCTDKNRPALRGCMVRKTFHSLFDSCVRTFDTLTKGMPLSRLGGKTYRDRIIFPNKSEIICVGLDDPLKLQSSEWGFIYINQAEEITESDFEMIAGCCTGRGTNVAYPQIFGDCNPGGSRHWIRARATSGKLTLLNSTHKDNPALYDAAGNITAAVTVRIGFLDSSLSGVRRKRLLEGLWASAEGAVYDMFDSTPGGPHVRERDERKFTRWFLALDEGYTNPQVNLLIGEDSDKRWHVAREFYVTGKLESEIVEQAKGWFLEKHCEIAACDEAAAGLIAALNNAGVNTKGGKGRILDGIYKIQDRLKVQGDGRSRLTVHPACINTINEFESYQWKPEKDVPVDAHNHSLGCLRYLQDVLNEPTGAWTAEAFKQATVGAPPGHQRQAGGWQPPPRVFTPRRLF
jgi:phage terminase large subunit